MSLSRSVVNDLVLSVFSKFRNFRHRDPHTMRVMVEKTLIKRQIPDQGEIKRLGHDLNTATFILDNQGKFKIADNLAGKSDWSDSPKYLPKNFDPNFLLQKIDLSGATLYYEGLEHFSELPRLESLNLSGVKNLDDWYCDRLAFIFSKNSSLSELDLSNCDQVTERGLSTLVRIRSLTLLNITNTAASRSPSLELFKILFNDILPHVEIRHIEEEKKIIT